MKLCALLPARLAAAATRALSSCGRRMVVVDTADANVARKCYTLHILAPDTLAWAARFTIALERRLSFAPSGLERLIPMRRSGATRLSTARANARPKVRGRSRQTHVTE